MIRWCCWYADAERTTNSAAVVVVVAGVVVPPGLLLSPRPVRIFIWRRNDINLILFISPRNLLLVRGSGAFTMQSAELQYIFRQRDRMLLLMLMLRCLRVGSRRDTRGKFCCCYG